MTTDTNLEHGTHNWGEVAWGAIWSLLWPSIFLILRTRSRQKRRDRILGYGLGIVMLFLFFFARAVALG